MLIGKDLRRTHSVFSRAHSAFSRTSGQDAGTQCLFAPTAGTQCLSRLRRSLRKQAARSLFSAPQGKLYGSKPIALQKRERKKSTVPTRHPENSSEKHRRTQPWEFPGLGPCCLLGKSLPLYFRLANGYRAVLHGTCNILRGRAASFAPTAGTQCLPRLRLTSGRDAPTAFPEKAKLKRVCFPLHRGNPTEAISQSSRHNA